MKNKQNFAFRKISRQAGFTLIELLVVIVIIGILATISVSSFNGYMEEARLAKAQSFARQFQNQIMRQGIIEDKNMFTSWFKGDKASDFAPGAYKVLMDSSESGNYLSHGIGPVQDDETPFNTGTSMRFTSGFPWRFNGLGKKNYPENKITMATWVKFDEIRDGDTWIIYFISDSGITIYPHDNYKMCFWVNVANSNSRICSESKPKTDKWYFVVGSYNGETEKMKFWINGDLVAKKEGISLVSPLAESLRLSSNFYGLMDDIIISPYAFNGEIFE